MVSFRPLFSILSGGALFGYSRRNEKKKSGRECFQQDKPIDLAEELPVSAVEGFAKRENAQLFSRSGGKLAISSGNFQLGEPNRGVPQSGFFVYVF